MQVNYRTFSNAEEEIDISVNDNYKVSAVITSGNEPW